MKNAINVRKVWALTDSSCNIIEAKWNCFLEEQLKAATKHHTGNKASWFKSAFRSGNRVKTIETGGNQALAAVGVGFGGAGLSTAFAGAGATAAVTGAAAALAVTLYALPIAVALTGFAYWGYQKNQKKKVNIEIRDWYYLKRASIPVGQEVDITTELEDALALRWIGWFADCGIENMGHLRKKLKEADDTFVKNIESLKMKKKALIRETNVYHTLASIDPVRHLKLKATKRQALIRAAEDLAKSYVSLGEDHQYIQYRIDRYKMYTITLQIAVTNYTRIQKTLREGPDKDLFSILEKRETAFGDQASSLGSLYSQINDLK